MGVRCPACNKPDQTGGACVRCGCDLEALQGIVAEAASHLGRARAACRAGDWGAGLREATRSWGLVHSADAARLAFMAAGAAGRTGEALRWYDRALGEE